MYFPIGTCEECTTDSTNRKLLWRNSYIPSNLSFLVQVVHKSRVNMLSPRLHQPNTKLKRLRDSIFKYSTLIGNSIYSMCLHDRSLLLLIMNFQCWRSFFSVDHSWGHRVPGFMVIPPYPTRQLRPHSLACIDTALNVIGFTDRAVGTTIILCFATRSCARVKSWTKVQPHGHCWLRKKDYFFRNVRHWYTIPT